MKYSFKNIIAQNIRPFIIAEIAANHGGNITKAKRMITAAKKAGAHAVKIQTYEAKSMTINSNKSDFKIKHGIWEGQNLFALYDSAKTPFSWHKSLFKHAKKEGIIIFSTPFDYEGVDLLDSLNVPFFKIAASTSSAEYKAEKPLFVNSSRIGFTNSSGYIIFLNFRLQI